HVSTVHHLPEESCAHFRLAACNWNTASEVSETTRRGGAVRRAGRFGLGRVVDGPDASPRANVGR
ncbi:MAG: hypothetical protein ACYTKD_12065, partial [Planctomycetota bacterium]